MMDYIKPVAAYGATAGLSWIASRYHLSGDQVAAIGTDLAGIGAAAYGLYLHKQALDTPTTKEAGK
jgi:hypothetical protein